MELLQHMFSIGLVFALLGGALWWLRRKNFAHLGRAGRDGRGRHALDAVGRIALTAQHSVHIIRAGGRALVVAVHPAGAVLLDSLPWREFEQGANAAEAGGER